MKSKIKHTVCDVESNYRYYVGLLLNRMVNLFDWHDLPETVDKQYLCSLLFLTGKATFFKSNDALYIADCAIGGELDEYYFPKYAILANPVLGSKNLLINTDCAIVYTSTADKINNNVRMGDVGYIASCPTYGLITKTAELLADCMSSINIVQKNARASFVVTAPTDNVRVQMDMLLKRMYDGEPYTTVTDSAFADNRVTVLPLTTTVGNTTLRELRETQQYYLSQFYHAIGVDSNSNFKRERLTTAELDSESEPLQINIIDMINSVKEGIEQVNKMFGTHITVELNAQWRQLTERQESEVQKDDTLQNTERIYNRIPKHF